MRPHLPRAVLAITFVSSLALGCDGGSEPSDAGGSADAGGARDAGGAMDAGVDAGADDAGSVASDAGGGDAGSLDGAAGSDGGGAVCIDADGDGYGDGCSLGGDCDDTRADVHPGERDVCGDRVDSDCSGTADEGCPCPLLTVSCPTGCCDVPIVELDMRGEYPSIATDADGFIYVSYTIPSSTVWGSGFAIYDPDAGTWSTSRSSGAGYNSAVRVSPSGRVHHVYGGNTYAFRYRYSDDHGATWASYPIWTPSAIGGGIDVAIGASDVPHVVIQGSGPSVWSRMYYLVWNGTAWTSTELDMGTTEKAHPKIVLGFADRPHIFSEAYHPDGGTGSSVRHAFYDGARWVYENVDAGDNYGQVNDYYSVVQPAALPDDTMRVVFARWNSGAPAVMRATRGPLTTDGWTSAALPGITAPFRNAIYLHDVAGAPFVVTDGVVVYRESGGSFGSVSTGAMGDGPAAAEYGDRVLIAYASTEPSTSNRLYLTSVPRAP
ncbi:MAG: MopE-related protein [Sandaracinaceae bacterium]